MFYRSLANILQSNLCYLGLSLISYFLLLKNIYYKNKKF